MANAPEGDDARGAKQHGRIDGLDKECLSSQSPHIFRRAEFEKSRGRLSFVLNGAPTQT